MQSTTIPPSAPLQVYSPAVAGAFSCVNGSATAAHPGGYCFQRVADDTASVVNALLFGTELPVGAEFATAGFTVACRDGAPLGRAVLGFTTRPLAELTSPDHVDYAVTINGDADYECHAEGNSGVVMADLHGATRFDIVVSAARVYFYRNGEFERSFERSGGGGSLRFVALLFSRGTQLWAPSAAAMTLTGAPDGLLVPTPLALDNVALGERSVAFSGAPQLDRVSPLGAVSSRDALSAPCVLSGMLRLAGGGGSGGFAVGIASANDDSLTTAAPLLGFVKDASGLRAVAPGATAVVHAPLVDGVTFSITWDGRLATLVWGSAFSWSVPYRATHAMRIRAALTAPGVQLTDLRFDLPRSGALGALGAPPCAAHVRRSRVMLLLVLVLVASAAAAAAVWVRRSSTVTAGRAASAPA